MNRRFFVGVIALLVAGVVVSVDKALVAVTVAVALSVVAMTVTD
jgi:hypothetical protein